MRTSGWMAAVLLGSSTMMWAQGGTSSTVKDDLFAGTEKFAANASSVTEVDMDPDSLGMVNGHNSDRARRTVLSVVHTYSYDKPGMYNMADVDAFRNKLNTGDWHCSVHVRELKSGESTDVCRKHRSDDLEESAIITVEPKELTFIHTIKRPAAPGHPGGGDSFLTVPFGGGVSLEDGLPASALSAELRANTAEMRVQGLIARAEMAAVRPEMIANMAAMRADTAGMMPGVPMNFYMANGGANLSGLSPLDAAQLPTLRNQLKSLHGGDNKQLQDLSNSLGNLPGSIEFKPLSPEAHPPIKMYLQPDSGGTGKQ